MENKNLLTVIFAVVGVIVGLAGGYFIGNSVGFQKGVAEGKNQAVSEQALNATVAEIERLSEIQKAANPFSETKDAANPFKNSYTNPFAQ
jgi:hypothetical protein